MSFVEFLSRFIKTYNFTQMIIQKAVQARLCAEQFIKNLSTKVISVGISSKEIEKNARKQHKKKEFTHLFVSKFSQKVNLFD